MKKHNKFALGRTKKHYIYAGTVDIRSGSFTTPSDTQIRDSAYGLQLFDLETQIGI